MSSSTHRTWWSAMYAAAVATWIRSRTPPLGPLPTGHTCVHTTPVSTICATKATISRLSARSAKVRSVTVHPAAHKESVERQFDRQHNGDREYPDEHDVIPDGDERRVRHDHEERELVDGQDPALRLRLHHVRVHALEALLSRSPRVFRELGVHGEGEPSVQAAGLRPVIAIDAHANGRVIHCNAREVLVWPTRSRVLCGGPAISLRVRAHEIRRLKPLE